MPGKVGPELGHRQRGGGSPRKEGAKVKMWNVQGPESSPLLDATGTGSVKERLRPTSWEGPGPCMQAFSPILRRGLGLKHQRLVWLLRAAHHCHLPSSGVSMNC